MRMTQVAENTPLSQARTYLSKGLEKNSLSLPVLPEVAQRIISLTHDPEADVNELSVLIHHDQALAGYVLKVANSAAYAGGSQIVSLQQAVARIGMKLLGSIALAITLQDETFRIPAYADMSKGLMRHALASGVYAKELARMKRINVEGLFLCGMMHTMGKPVVLKLLAGWCQREQANLSTAQMEVLIEEFHIPVGQALAESWNLPQQIRLCAQYYQQPFDAPTFRKETLITALASRLGLWIVEPQSDSPEQLAADEAFVELNIYPDEVDDLLEKQDDVRAEVSALEL